MNAYVNRLNRQIEKNDAELTKLKADVARLRTSIRHLLLSADAVWYEKNEGHDWRVAVDEAALALEETKSIGRLPPLNKWTARLLLSILSSAFF